MNKLPVIVKAFLLFIVVWGLLVSVLCLSVYVIHWLQSQGMSSEDAGFWILVIVITAFLVGFNFI